MYLGVPYAFFNKIFLYLLKKKKKKKKKKKPLWGSQTQNFTLLKKQTTDNSKLTIPF
jgi:hypothetical protein